MKYIINPVETKRWVATLSESVAKDIVRTPWQPGERNRNVCADDGDTISIIRNNMTPVVHALNYVNWLSGVSTLWEAKLTR